MISKINNILKNSQIDVYSFISTSQYIKERTKLNKLDGFSDYQLLKPYKTIITLGISYPKEEVKYMGKGYGILSRYSYGTDYHIIFKKIIEDISSQLNDLGINNYGSVDTGFIDERFAASLSGLGFLGKNQFLINKKLGSYLYLATLLIDYDEEQLNIVTDNCGDCTLCIDACPSNALDNGFDKDKCISFTSQSKKSLNFEEISYFKSMIYGCDICQKVCPKNKGIDLHKHIEFEPSGIENVSIKDLFNMTNKEYMSIYGTNSSSWKGPLIIKRNALGIILNQNLVDLVSDIEKSVLKYKETKWYTDTAMTVLEKMRKE